MKHARASFRSARRNASRFGVIAWTIALAPLSAAAPAFADDLPGLPGLAGCVPAGKEVVVVATAHEDMGGHDRPRFERDGDVYVVYRVGTFDLSYTFTASHRGQTLTRAVTARDGVPVAEMGNDVMPYAALEKHTFLEDGTVRYAVGPAAALEVVAEYAGDGKTAPGFNYLRAEGLAFDAVFGFRADGGTHCLTPTDLKVDALGADGPDRRLRYTTGTNGRVDQWITDPARGNVVLEYRASHLEEGRPVTDQVVAVDEVQRAGELWVPKRMTRTINPAFAKGVEGRQDLSVVVDKVLLKDADRPDAATNFDPPAGTHVEHVDVNGKLTVRTVEAKEPAPAGSL